MIATMLAAFALSAGAAPAPKDSFVLSVQAWTFNKFTLFEAIEKTAEAGVTNIEMFPGQTLRPGSDVKVGPEMPAEETQRLKDQLAKFHVRPVAFGVTGIPKAPDAARPLFRWAKDLGLMVVNTESVESLDTIEKMVKEFDIKVGFHDHPKRANDPNYKMWDPNYVYSLVKDRDKRIGSCADTGHWVRSGIKPVDAIRILKGRIVSSHLKDLNAFNPDAHDVPFGTGVSDMAGIFDSYRRIGFEGPGSIEYEYNWDNSVIDVANCAGFVRGYLRGK
ncbi:MAG: sugar phosphate isomerase/epimerase [Armatimonadetes bacterium]|nr:sugar phosphate isomerase/epimerase [Armatimonadota bacterium]